MHFLSLAYYPFDKRCNGVVPTNEVQCEMKTVERNVNPSLVENSNPLPNFPAVLNLEFVFLLLITQCCQERKLFILFLLTDKTRYYICLPPTV